MGPQNAIVGDAGVELPQTTVPEEDLSQERSKAKFSQSAEFQRLKNHIDQRILFYQTQLPDGTAIATSTDIAKLGQNVLVANLVISELGTILAAYEQAREVVKAADERKVQ